MVLDLINGTITTYEGGWNLVDVRDVAEVHAAAVEMGELGRRYIVGGENLHERDIAQLIQELAGVIPRHIGITGPLAYLIASCVELGSKLTGTEPPYTRSVVHDMIGRYAYYDCTPTYETFGLSPRPAREAVRECVRWLLFVDKIDPGVAARISDALPPDPEWRAAKS
jgi:dihydroflavonol-4-reductase